MKPVFFMLVAAFFNVDAICVIRCSLGVSLRESMQTFRRTISNLFPDNCLKIKEKNVSTYMTKTGQNATQGTNPNRNSLLTYEKCPTRMIAFPPDFEFPPPCLRSFVRSLFKIIKSSGVFLYKVQN